MMATLSARAPRRLSAPLVLMLPALLFGLLVTLQWRTQLERSELTVRYNAPLLDAAKSLQNEQDALRAQLADLRTQLDDIQRGAASQTTSSRDLQARIDELRAAAGLTERTGDPLHVEARLPAPSGASLARRSWSTPRMRATPRRTPSAK